MPDGSKVLGASGWVFAAVWVALAGGCAVFDGMGGNAGGDQRGGDVGGDPRDGYSPGRDSGGGPGDGDAGNNGGAGDDVKDGPAPNPADGCAPACPQGSICVSGNLCQYPVQFAAGGAHYCAIFENNTIWCSGKNDKGQLGNGTTDSSSGYVQADTHALGWTASDRFVSIAAGAKHTCAATDTGQVACWGANSHGQLGDVNWSDQKKPKAVVFTRAFSVSGRTPRLSAGREHSCVLDAQGAVYCWGQNEQRQSGGGTAQDASYTRVRPGEFEALSEAVVADTAAFIVSGAEHTCVWDADGATRLCWGANLHGQLGLRFSTYLGNLASNILWRDSWTGSNQAYKNVYFKQITTGAYHTCAVVVPTQKGTEQQEGVVYCWGAGDQSQLGDVRSSPMYSPGDVGPVSRTMPTEPILASALAAGEDFSCAQVSAQQVMCWGKGTRSAHQYAREVKGLNVAEGVEIVDIDATDEQICVMLKQKDGPQAEIRCVPVPQPE